MRSNTKTRFMFEKRNYFLLLVLLNLAVLTPGKGQFLTEIHSLYRFHLPALNPAAVNHLNLFDPSKTVLFNGSYRNQWMGLDVSDRPSTATARFEYITSEDQQFTRMKYGMFISRNTAGHISYSRVQGNLGIIMALGNNHMLSAGLSFGGANLGISLNEVNWVGSGINGDLNPVNNWHYDLSLGLFWQYLAPREFSYRGCDCIKPLKWYFGVSIPQVFIDDLYQSNISEGFINREYPVYMVGGTKLGVSSDLFVEPSVWVRWLIPDTNGSSVVPSSVDANIRLEYSNFGWIGAGYGTGFGALGNTAVIHTELGRDFPFDDNRFRLSLGAGMDIDVGKYVGLGNTFEFSVGFGY